MTAKIMWCLVSLPNSVIVEVQVDSKAIGLECLEKVCRCLDINNEIDYFGLKYRMEKKNLWLNLRNPIENQVIVSGGGLGSTSQLPIRLEFRVKFWVPPHLLLQDSTRNQFYLNARLDLIEARLLVPKWTNLIKLIALIYQAEYGFLSCSNSSSNFAVYENWSKLITVRETLNDKPHDFLQNVFQKHIEFKDMKKSTAKYWILNEIATYSGFGEDKFHTKLLNVPIDLGIGPEGISIYQSNNFKQSIPFNVIQSASSHRRTFRLEYLNSSASNRPENRLLALEVKLLSSQLASGLYRAITEKHAFYSCETVRSAVTTQFIRDLKGTIVSMFNEDTNLGKKFVFDIRKTCREVYDDARRALHQSSKDSCSSSMSGSVHAVNRSTNVNDTLAINANHYESDKDNDNQNNDVSNTCDNDTAIHRNESEEKLTKLVDAMTCKICMDRTLNCVFLPCAHLISCLSCASRCDRCPLCRTVIDQSKQIYLPAGIIEQIKNG